MLQLNFNLGSTLTGFQTNWPSSVEQLQCTHIPGKATLNIQNTTVKSQSSMKISTCTSNRAS